MVEIVQILVVLLVVVAAVAVVAARLEIPPAILLVSPASTLALIPGLPAVELAPELVLLLVLPPVIYSSAVAMSWSEFRFNLRTISSAGGWVRGVHHRRGRGGGPLAPRPAVAGGFRAGRDRLAAGRRGAAVDPAQDAASPAHPGRPRRRGIGQRRHRAHPLPVRGRRGERRRVFVRSGDGNVRRHRHRRNPLGHRRRLADAAAAALGAQSAGRDHALCADAVSRLLAARASRRLRRARNRHCRALHQLERPSPDQRRHQAARNFLLELFHLPGRGPGVPRHRPAGAHADRPHRTLSGVRARPFPLPSSASS